MDFSPIEHVSVDRESPPSLGQVNGTAVLAIVLCIVVVSFWIASRDAALGFFACMMIAGGLYIFLKECWRYAETLRDPVSLKVVNYPKEGEVCSLEDFRRLLLADEMTIEDYEKNRLPIRIANYRQLKAFTRVNNRLWEHEDPQGEYMTKHMVLEYFAQQLEAHEFGFCSGLSEGMIDRWAWCFDYERNQLINDALVLDWYCRAKGITPKELLACFPVEDYEREKVAELLEAD